MSLPWRKKLTLTLKMNLIGDGYKRAELLKKKNIFGLIGDNVYYYSRVIPADPERVYLHNNVVIATNVYFCTHDIIDLMLNNLTSKELVEYSWGGKIIE